MPNLPANPKIYHITHVENLPQILADGRLLSDAIVNQRGGPNTAIGMSTIKARRLSLPVACHPGDKVGEYVPFYFCPRSVMLYIIYQGNHREVAYTGGQEPILHLEAALDATLRWAIGQGKRWAFTLSNAGAIYAQFRSDPAQLSEIDWDAVAARDWRAPEVREGKQAEFLMHEEFPWHLVQRIGVFSRAVHSQVRAIIGAAAQPLLEIKRDWYY